MAHAVVTGMQGEDERYLQIVAGCKHYVPYDGNALTAASDFDLFSTYLLGFKRCMEAEGPAWKGACFFCFFLKRAFFWSLTGISAWV